MTHMLKRIRLTGLIVALAIALYALWNFGINGNFHAIIEDEVYRSAQVTPAQIARYQSRYHIRSIINLRGENTGKKWYDDEIAASTRLNIKHIDFRMSSHRELSPDQAMQLITLMRDAPKPLLIHCESGINRTGLAAALYIAGVEGGSEFDSELQLSILYGDVPFSFSRAYAMMDSFEEIEPLFGFDS